MRPEPNLRIEPFRSESHIPQEAGRSYGLFVFSHRGARLRVISSGLASDRSFGEWEHVSVSLENRCPTWEEMCFVKDQFFDDEETVVQFHPAKSQYKQYHPYCLHMWRHKDGHQLPPPETI